MKKITLVFIGLIALGSSRASALDCKANAAFQSNYEFQQPSVPVSVSDDESFSDFKSLSSKDSGVKLTFQFRVNRPNSLFDSPSLTTRLESKWAGGISTFTESTVMINPEGLTVVKSELGGQMGKKGEIVLERIQFWAKCTN